MVTLNEFEMKNLIKYLLFFAVLGLIGACSKSDLNNHEPINKDGEIPGQVTNVKIENGPGSAIITYTLPKSQDLQYVLAKYSINKEIVREAKSSRYGDTIRVDGFNKEGEYQVELFSVSKSEKLSEPVVIKVNPSEPTFRTIAKSMSIREDFGGMNVTFQNPEESKIAVVILTKDNNDEFSPTETFYTAIKNGSFSVRGYEPELRTFGVYIKDRWNNHSDTVYKEVKPLFEKILDKSKFRQYVLPGDQPAAWGWVMSNMWDNKLGEPGFHTLQGALPRPHKFTFDLGALVKLSRFKLLQRTGDWFYAHGNPKEWRMYGSATVPDASGEMDKWIKLMDCYSVKPSGLPVGQVSDDDRNHANGIDGLGEEFNFPLNAPPVRYIRMEIIKNWGNTDFFHALELTFWGDPQ